MAENETPTPSTESTALDPKEFDKALRNSWEERRRLSQRSGPRYNDPESDPLIWYDQIWEREITPSGTVNGTYALRVGGTQNALDVILVGSHANTGAVQAASGATVTLMCLQADSEDGTFEAVGPSYCVTAPTEGIKADPDALFCRIPIGNFRKPWLKIKLVFSGTISGGTLDAALSYQAR